MPDGFWPASPKRTYTLESAIPASAFSKGDLLVFDSNSSLSRIAWTEAAGMATGADIAGVAASDSIDSIDDQVPYYLPGPQTIWWASLDSASGDALRPGTETDVNFDVAEGRYYVDPASSNTVRAVIVRGADGVGSVDQSVQSKVLCKLIYHAGDIDIS